MRGEGSTDSHYANMQILESWGFEGPEYTLQVTGTESIIAYWQEMGELRKTSDWDMDGVVIKVDSIRHQEQLGRGKRAPKWALACKYSSDAAPPN